MKRLITIYSAPVHRLRDAGLLEKSTLPLRELRFLLRKQRLLSCPCSQHLVVADALYQNFLRAIVQQALDGKAPCVLTQHFPIVVRF